MLIEDDIALLGCDCVFGLKNSYNCCLQKCTLAKFAVVSWLNQSVFLPRLRSTCSFLTLLFNILLQSSVAYHNWCWMLTQGFICPMCMINLPSPEALTKHFDVAHSDLDQPSSPKNSTTAGKRLAFLLKFEWNASVSLKFVSW